MTSKVRRRLGPRHNPTQWEAGGFRDGVVIEKNALVLGGVQQRIPCRCRLERPHLRIGEQTFCIRLSAARFDSAQLQLWAALLHPATDPAILGLEMITID
jgi:hypothetical protein